MLTFIHQALLPHLRGLDIDTRTGLLNPGASRKQRIMTAMERVRVDSETNLADILDKVREINIDQVDDTHFFTLSQVYEDLLLKTGEKSSDGGQFFTPREVIRAREKQARELEADAAAIDAAVFDLKAENPNAVAAADDRTPAQIIAHIQAQGRVISDALARLAALREEERQLR